MATNYLTKWIPEARSDHQEKFAWNRRHSTPSRLSVWAARERAGEETTQLSDGNSGWGVQSLSDGASLVSPTPNEEVLSFFLHAQLPCCSSTHSSPHYVPPSGYATHKRITRWEHYLLKVLSSSMDLQPFVPLSLKAKTDIASRFPTTVTCEVTLREKRSHYLILGDFFIVHIGHSWVTLGIVSCLLGNPANSYPVGGPLANIYRTWRREGSICITGSIHSQTSCFSRSSGVPSKTLGRTIGILY